MSRSPLRYRSPLTAREQQILDLLADGLTVRQAAIELGLAFKTVDAHKQHIYIRLGAGSLADAVRSERHRHRSSLRRAGVPG